MVGVHWREYLYNFAIEDLGIHQEDLEEAAREMSVCGSLVSLFLFKLQYFKVLRTVAVYVRK